MLHFPDRGSLSAFSITTCLGLLAALSFPEMSSAQEQNLIVIQAPSEAVHQKMTYADVHRILMIDVSDSMDSSEVMAAFAGALGYYESDEIKIEQKTAICSANTIIFYGTYPKVTDTWVVCNQHDLQGFVDAALNTDIAEIRKATASTTTESSLTLALIAAADVFETETQNSISSASRSVLFVSDEYGGDDQGRIDAARDGLVRIYQASVGAIALGDGHLSARFQNHVVSSPEVLTKYGVTSVAPKKAYGIETPEAGKMDQRTRLIEEAIKASFSLGMG